MEKEYEFWPDQVAKELVKKWKVKKQVITTGTSMSGEPHIGSANDVVRGHAVYLALKRMKVSAELVWVSDDMDPLRSVPKDLPKELVNYLGVPVCFIPDFWSCHKNFAEHFEEKFIQQLKTLLIEPKILKGIEMYKKGMYNNLIKLAMKKREKIVKILNNFRTTPLPEDWYPVDVICEKCGKISTTRILKYEEKKASVEYECVEEATLLKKKYEVNGCGYKGKTSILNGKAKLTWRVEWPARWVILKTTCEPFGKEHAAAGGSWDTGKEIVKILGWKPPYPLVYEHFLVNGQKMSKSLGNVITVPDMLKYMKPEHLRYWMFQGRLTIAKDINLKQMVPSIWNEFDKAERIYFGLQSSGNERKDNNFKRAYELAVVKPKEASSVYVPFEVMVEIVKILPEKDQVEFAVRKLKEYRRLKEENGKIKEEVAKRIEFAKRWYEDFGKIKEEVEVKIGEKEKAAIAELIKIVEREESGEEIQKNIFEIARKFDIKIPNFFKLLYKIILNSESGPKLGFYIIERGKEEILKKLKEAIR
ncbi:MAG: lysine--tRNA ligase [Candidatus Aenigmatarchaeota archaeon]